MDELLNWLKDGKYRRLVLKELSSANLLSSELADKLNIHRASMSRILKLLKNKDLITSSSGKSRTTTYSITPRGKSYLNKI